MAINPAVEAEIDALNLKWGAATPVDPARSPGRVMMRCPVDKTTMVEFSVPGKIIRHCGFESDVTGASYDNILILESDEADPTRDRRGGRTGGQFLNQGSLIGRKFTINLASPVPNDRNGTQVLISKMSLRVPQIISIDCFNWFLYNHSSDALRPASFETEHKRYFVSDIPVANLGELSDLVEDPASDD